MTPCSSCARWTRSTRAAGHWPSRLARELAGGSFAGRNVAVLGAAFKPDTDDVRDSPALSVARTIQSEGAVVRVHDPRATYNARQAWPALDYVEEAVKACEAADVVLHLTEWTEYRELDPAAAGLGGPDPVPARRAQRAPAGPVAGRRLDRAIHGSTSARLRHGPAQAVGRQSLRQPHAAANRPVHRRRAGLIALLGAVVMLTVACSAWSSANSHPAVRPIASTTYYLSPSGSDAAAGISPAKAWRTLGRASRAVLRPGDRLLLEGGQQFSGQLTIGESDGGDGPAR